MASGPACSGARRGSDVLNVDEAFSAASVNTAGLSASLANEFGSLVHPLGPSLASRPRGRGSGLELGIGTDVPVDPTPIAR